MPSAADVSATHVALAAMAYLLAKHAVADFLLQTDFIYRQKGIYGAPGGLVHALEHVALTAPVFLLFPSGSAGLAAAILVAEFAVHYHIDWTKEHVVRWRRWKFADREYWCALGFDQLLHGLTYVAILWVWLPAA